MHCGGAGGRAGAAAWRLLDKMELDGAVGPGGRLHVDSGRADAGRDVRRDRRVVDARGGPLGKTRGRVGGYDSQPSLRRPTSRLKDLRGYVPIRSNDGGAGTRGADALTDVGAQRGVAG